MTKEHTTADLIAQARKWERGYGEGYWFNAMADEIERLDADAAGAQAELASVKACWAEALGNVATRNREIEQLRRERHQLRNELTAARLENQQRRALLVEVYNHGENSELHGRIGAALGAAPGEDASPVEPGAYAADDGRMPAVHNRAQLSLCLSCHQPLNLHVGFTCPPPEKSASGMRGPQVITYFDGPASTPHASSCGIFSSAVAAPCTCGAEKSGEQA